MQKKRVASRMAAVRSATWRSRLTGANIQLSTVGEKRSAYINAQAGISKIFAVWPGRWRSDLFIIDDLDAFSEKQSLFGKYR